MPIINLQRRQTEVGRIRIGESIDTGRKNKHGQPIRRPKKLEKFRFTSPSQTLIEQVAKLYGGQPAEWQPQGGGATQWEVFTDARSVPVVVPPNSVSQWYESWIGGLCTRRCDGERELLKDKPCMCSPDPLERECKPTTRISLMLADIPGIGVWRLETHGFYAATELPAVAELLARSGGHIAARLELEQRTAKRPKANGGVETRHWMVPVLHVDAAPAQLLSLSRGNSPSQQAISGSGTTTMPALEAMTAERALELIANCKTLPQLRGLWEEVGQSNATDERVKNAFAAMAKNLQPKAVDVAPAEVEAVNDGVEPNPDAVWSQIMSVVPANWGTDVLESRVQKYLNKSSIDANGFELSRFLVAVQKGEIL